MRQFVKKLQEISSGSKRLLSGRELSELMDFVSSRRHRIVATQSSVYTELGCGEHDILIPLTEHDAVRIFKAICPITFTRKTPYAARFCRQ